MLHELVQAGEEMLPMQDKIKEKERRTYNQSLRELQNARERFSVELYEKAMIAHDERWSPEVVERRKREGLYKQWARDRV